MQLLVNITARSPRLVARGLPPGQVLFLRVYASNSKGRSRSVRIDGYTLRMADKRPGKIIILTAYIFDREDCRGSKNCIGEGGNCLKLLYLYGSI